MFNNKCPNCGSSRISHHKKAGAAWLVFFFISMGLGLVMYPFLPTEYVCRDCKSKWNA